MSSEIIPKLPVVYSETFLINYATVDCENPDRVAEIVLRAEDVAEFVEPDACNLSDLLLCHAGSLVRSVERDKETYRVATLAAGAAIMAAEIALDRPSFALIRPPGHHAGIDFNGGFCFFNNMAIAIRKLISLRKVRTALIVDIDLHDGNGTYDIFQRDRAVTFKNILADTREDFFQQLESALVDAPAYDILGCSAGFDTYVKDWGALLLTEDYFKAGSMMAQANAHFFSVLEGGYYISDLGKNVRSYLQGIQQACS